MKKTILIVALLINQILCSVSPSRDLVVPLMHGCGNIEFDINFMRPILFLKEAKMLKNFTITDTMDLNNPMKVTLNGNSKLDEIKIEQFHKNICTKRLLLEVCIMDENMADNLPIRVEVAT